MEDMISPDLLYKHPIRITLEGCRELHAPVAVVDVICVYLAVDVIERAMDAIHSDTSGDLPAIAGTIGRCERAVRAAAPYFLQLGRYPVWIKDRHNFEEFVRLPVPVDHSQWNKFATAIDKTVTVGGTREIVCMFSFVTPLSHAIDVTDIARRHNFDPRLLEHRPVVFSPIELVESGGILRPGETIVECLLRHLTVQDAA